MGQKPFELRDRNGEVIDVILPTWADNKRCVKKYRLRNSLFHAIMPTATSSGIRRNCESVEAHQSNVYSRKLFRLTASVVNRYMLWDLEELGLWNKYTKEYLKMSSGSIQTLPIEVHDYSENYPEFNGNWSRLYRVVKKYKTMWELGSKLFIELAADRGRYICHSQSMNLYVNDSSSDIVRKACFHAYYKGLKTIRYYLRTGNAESTKFTRTGREDKSVVVAENLVNKDEDMIEKSAGTESVEDDDYIMKGVNSKLLFNQSEFSLLEDNPSCVNGSCSS